MVLSLCRVLGITLYFSEGFLEAVAEALQLLEQESSLWSLALVTGQLAVAGQLGREVHPWRIRLFLGSGGWR